MPFKVNKTPFKNHVFLLVLEKYIQLIYFIKLNSFDKHVYYNSSHSELISDSTKN